MSTLQLRLRRNLPAILENRKVLTVLMVMALAAYAIGTALAGNQGNATFGTAEKTILGWLQGSLGVILALSFFAIGVAIGIARQSLIAIATGLAAAFTLYYGPTVITSIVAASVGVHLLG